MNKIINFTKKHQAFFITSFLYLIMLLFLIKKTPLKLFLITSSLLYIYIVIFFLITSKHKLNIQKTFLLLAVPLGIFMLIAIPLGNMPDEKAHLARAYEISEFHIISKISKDNRVGNILPEEIHNLNGYQYTYQETISNLFSKSPNRVFTEFSNTALYSFISYIPQVLGIFLGKILNCSLYITAYLGRITNFAVWLSLIYFSIKLIPFGKNTLLFLSLMPITLQGACSLSPDALTYGSSVLLFSFVFSKIKSNKLLVKKDYLIMSILCLVVSLCKIAYLPLCLLIILIPKELYENTKKKWHFIISLALLVIIVNSLWLYFANNFLMFARFNPELQKEYILKNPFNYALIILRTTYYTGEIVVKGIFSNFLESFTINMPYITVFLNMIIFSIFCFQEKISTNYTNNFTKTTIVIIVFSVFILINTCLYLQWTKTYNSMIEGLQGRYFLPIMYLIPVLFMKSNKKISYNIQNYNLKNFLYSYLMLQNILAIILIITKHI